MDSIVVNFVNGEDGCRECPACIHELTCKYVDKLESIEQMYDSEYGWEDCDVRVTVECRMFENEKKGENNG